MGTKGPVIADFTKSHRAVSIEARYSCVAESADSELASSRLGRRLLGAIQSSSHIFLDCFVPRKDDAGFRVSTLLT